MAEGAAPPAGGLVRVRLDLAYDGTAFAGWARQPGLRTVQGELEAALARVLRLPGPPSVVVAGRTDAGVHARGQVVHADVPAGAWAAAPGRSARTPGEALVTRLAGVLPPDVAVRRAAPAPPGFDARFAALRRRYAYRLSDAAGGPDPLRRHDVVDVRRAGVRPGRPLDVAAMDAASAALEGLHDFAAYCRPREGATTTRTLLRYRWRRAGDGEPAGEAGLLVAEVVADAFCHSMVRALVGAALAVGSGRRPAGWPAQVLARAVRDPALTVAPAHGLVLESVDYPDDAGLAARVLRARARREPPAALPAATPAGGRGSLGGMSTPGTSPDQDPVTSLADVEDDAYASARLDQGISPNEREVRVGRFGMTADEELAGETIEERLAEEEPDPSASLALDGADDADDADDLELPADQPAGGDPDGELLDDEVGDARAGRLVEPDQGASTDREQSAVASDAGIDGGGASAEEAAVHVVPDVEDDDRA